MKEEVSVSADSYTNSVENSNMEVDLEEGLDKAGMGRYQVFHYILMSVSLFAPLVEMNSNALILPAATCDLVVPDKFRGILLSIHNIGAIITGPFWGQAADSWGRKSVLILTSAAGGCLCLMSAFMPNLLSFALCKLVGSLFLAAPASIGYVFVSELVPRAKRDSTVLICNGLILLTCGLVPATAWAILSFHWEYDVGFIVLRPWRLLTAVYTLPLILVAVLLTQTYESPKFLMTKGKNQEALEVLRSVYSVNTGLSPETYPVTRLNKLTEEYGIVSEEYGSEDKLVSKMKGGMLDILQLPHLKWITLVSALMFGNSFILPGLFLFTPDVINKVMSHDDPSVHGTVCLLINQVHNKTDIADCVDNVSQRALIIMTVCTSVYGVLVLLISLCPVSKKIILIITYVILSAACFISGLITNRIVASVAMTAFQMASMSIGPISAYTVQLFPTNLRGKALSVMSTFGRIGSVVGAAAAGFFLALACSATFCGFATLMLVLAALSLLLPSPSEKPATVEDDLQSTFNERL